VRDGLVRLWDGLADEHRALATQLIRYGIVGVGVTTFQTLLYNLLLGAGHQRPQIANILASGAAMVVGYTIHSRFTFEAKGEAHDFRRTVARFITVNLVGTAINGFWVWLIEKQLGLSAHWASVPFFFVTPALLFVLNRKWVFD
jgi:putative flippase GtrA